MNIRTATLQDIDQIAAVEKECFPAAEAATKEEFEQRLSSAMKRDYTKAQATISKENGNGLEERADQYVTAIYGQKDSKTNAADIEKVRNDFIISNQFELVDLSLIHISEPTRH